MIVFSKFSKAIAVAALLTGTMAVDTAYAQVSYPMTCRGSGTLTIRNNGVNSVRISFQSGSGAAFQGLLPGQCSWSDRALRTGEPTTLCDSSVRAALYVGLLVQSNQYAIVQVYNDNQGCLRVTKFEA